MIDRLKQITELLKNGSVQHITAFGSERLDFSTPYCVIVPSALPDHESFQIWAHFAIGENVELERYVKEELPALMREARDIFGAPLFETNGTYNGVLVDPGEIPTIRAGKIFYLPLIIY